MVRLKLRSIRTESLLIIPHLAMKFLMNKRHDLSLPYIITEALSLRYFNHPTIMIIFIVVKSGVVC